MVFKRLIFQWIIVGSELNVDEKYKKTLEEIEALKDHLGKWLPDVQLITVLANGIASALE